MWLTLNPVDSYLAIFLGSQNKPQPIPPAGSFGCWWWCRPRWPPWPPWPRWPRPPPSHNLTVQPPVGGGKRLREPGSPGTKSVGAFSLSFYSLSISPANSFQSSQQMAANLLPLYCMSFFSNLPIANSEKSENCQFGSKSNSMNQAMTSFVGICDLF